MTTKAEDIITAFFVPGIPATAGSKRPFRNKVTGKISVVDTCKMGATWRSSVQTTAYVRYHGKVLVGPLALNVVFYSVRPRSHYGTGKNSGRLKAGCPQYPAKKPDATKLFRATEDALKGLIFKDDGQAVIIGATKLYGSRAGALVIVSRPPELSDDQLIANVYENSIESLVEIG